MKRQFIRVICPKMTLEDNESDMIVLIPVDIIMMVKEAKEAGAEEAGVNTIICTNDERLLVYGVKDKIEQIEEWLAQDTTY